MRTSMALALAVSVLTFSASVAADTPLPKVAKDWSIERIAEAPTIEFPTAVVVARDGTIYLGQDPMDMPGPVTEPIDSVVAIRDGRITTFADKLWSVMGLEWLEGTLYVVHAPFLSAFRDRDGDGRADERVDLITGLGPKLPGFNGINDHIASGLRLGMDGFLYIAVGDKGIPQGMARDGSTITMAGGGVIRVRPDGSGLEVVSTGERNPLSVALTASDEIFTFGNDDDSKQWPNSLTHHIVGGHHGYPYEFLNAPDRALPIVAGMMGGAGTQGIAYNEDGLPERYRGNLFFCDWGLQEVHRFRVTPDGGTFRLVDEEPLVEKGELKDFRPFSIAVDADGSSLILVDWAFNGWLVKGPKTGRIFRLRYVGPDPVRPAPRPSGSEQNERLKGLDHPAISARVESQRWLASKGDSSLQPLATRLRSGPGPGRVHAVWSLDAIGSIEARRLIRSVLSDPEASVRLQAARSSGIRRDREALPELLRLIGDPDPAVRREAAIAIGRLGEVSAAPLLYASFGDPDPFAAWSIRQAIRSLKAWDVPRLVEALGDLRRREDALKLADNSWAVPAIRALILALGKEKDPAWRARLVATLAGLYRREPAWSGQWFGTNPLAGPMARKTEDWDAQAQAFIRTGLALAIRDPDPLVRRPAIVGLFGIGTEAIPSLRSGLATETDATNLVALARAIGALQDAPAASLLARIIQDPNQKLEVRVASVDALSNLNSPIALRTLFALAYDAKAPAELISRVLPSLGLGRVLPANDLSGFLEHESATVRAAALTSFPSGRPLPEEVRDMIASKLDDSEAEVRRAAIGAIDTHEIREAIPRLIVIAEGQTDRAEAAQALAAMPDRRAFGVYLAALKRRDPAERRAAESALVVIRDQVRGELESEVARGRFVGASAMTVERILARFSPVVAWRVVGPFPRTSAFPFEDSSKLDFDRLLIGAGGRQIGWDLRPGDPESGRVVLDDLKGGADDRDGFGYVAGGSPDLAAYGYAEVTSDRDRSALMLVGSSGSVLVAVNDRPVLNYDDPAGRSFASDSDLVRIQLRKGLNRIVVRTRQGSGAWSYSVQISEPTSTSFAKDSSGLDEHRAFALSHTGDPRRGESIFFDPEGVGCFRCHISKGKGTSAIGPALDGIAAKYDKAEVVKSVLEPSARIANGYQPVVIARIDGTVLTGLIREETEAHLELIDSQARTIRVAKGDVETRRIGEISTMPTGLVDGLTKVEFADLIAYLMSLKAAR
ncbi:HEAT repeat domain-containing protein [Tundrisphaera lichenicola]|uniref:HEAT repeat domain-containing protein n=1 Tax=Tundrisphaera lichenicola TaxID=2029860 RepID=UPI003EBEDD38